MADVITDRMDGAQAQLARAYAEWEASKAERSDMAIDAFLADLAVVDRWSARLREALLEERDRRRGL